MGLTNWQPAQYFLNPIPSQYMIPPTSSPVPQLAEEGAVHEGFRKLEVSLRGVIRDIQGYMLESPWNA